MIWYLTVTLDKPVCCVYTPISLSAYSNSCFNLAMDMTHGSMGDTVWQNGPYNMFQIIINITRPEQEIMWQ